MSGFVKKTFNSSGDLGFLEPVNRDLRVQHAFQPAYGWVSLASTLALCPVGSTMEYWRDEEILDFQGRINATCIDINADDNYPIFFSPQQSLCDSLLSFTKHDYMRDGLRYDGKVNGDPYHANSSYGANVIKSIARFIPR